MPTHIAVPVLSGFGNNASGAGTNYLIETPAGGYYCVGIENGVDVYWTKSTDRGLTWTNPVLVFTGTATQLSVWYDEWSGVSGGKIRIAYTDAGIDDVLYRDLDVDTDTLGTETTIFAGASTAANGALSIVTARSGYIYCLLCIDAGAESEFALSTDGGATWDLTRSATGAFESASGDQWALLPGWAADSNDIMCIFWDASANELSRKLYDHSADTWSETSIAASMVELSPATAFPNFAVAVDTTNSRNLLVAWDGTDTANQDLKAWHITESTITALTDVVSNATDDCGLCAIGINTVTQDWTVFYAGKSDGSETWNTSLNIYYKVSTDDGTTWGAETKLTTEARDTNFLACVPRAYGPPIAITQRGYGSGVASSPIITALVPLRGPSARSQVGC